MSNRFHVLKTRLILFVRSNRYLSLLVLYYVLGFITPEKKLLIGLSVLFVVALWFLYRRWNTALVLGYVAMAPFAVGQVYKFQILTPAQLFFDPQYPEGRNLFFVLSPAFLVGIIILLKAIHVLATQKIRTMVNIETAVFLTSATIRFLSALQASYNQGLSVMYGLHRLMLAAWLILALTEYQRWRRVVRALLVTAALSAAFNGLLALLQLIKGGLVGTILEQRGTVIPGEISVSFFRPFGLESHPNFLANTLLFGIFISVILYLTTRVRHRNTVLSACIVSLVGLIISQSRAGYVSLAGGVALPAFVFFRRTKARITSLLRRRLSLRATLTGFVLIVLVTFFVIGRFYNTLLFSAEGGFSVRQKLNREAATIIREKPLLGVGPGMFISAAYERNVAGVMYWFPEAVHNGFLLVASESGIFALLLAIAFLFFVFRRSLTGRQHAYVRATIAGYVLSQIIFMWFHPVDNVTTLQMALVVLLLRSKANV